MGSRLLRLLFAAVLVFAMSPATMYAAPADEPAVDQELVALDLHLLQEGDYYWFSSDELALEAQDTTPLSDESTADFNAFVQEKLADPSNFITISGYDGWYVKLDVSEFNIGASSVGELQAYISRLLQRAVYEDPSLFYGSGDALMSYRLDSDTYWANEVYAKLAYTPTQIASMQVEYEAAMAEMLSWIPASATEAQKVKAVHDWLVRNCTYHPTAGHQTPAELGYRDPWNSYGALVAKQPVCEGFSLAFKDAMNRLGIEATVVTQRLSSGEGHAWNRVKVDGQWYNLDITHDDGKTARGDFDATPDTTYFLKSDAWFVANPSDEQWHTTWTPAGVAGTSTIYDDYTIDDWPTYSGPAPVIELVSFELSPSSLVLAPGATAQLSIANVVPEGASTTDAVWTSSDTSVATVSSDGLVTSTGTWGSATITCTVGEVSSECAIEVYGGNMSAPNADVQVFCGGQSSYGYVARPVWVSWTFYVTDPVTQISHTMVEDVDYEVVWPDDLTNVGAKVIQFNGIGTFTGTAQYSFQIAPRDIALGEVTVADEVELVDGPVEPAPTVVMWGNTTLVPGTDYVVSYQNNDAPGTATVTVAGKGNYTGSVQRDFTVYVTPPDTTALAAAIGQAEAILADTVASEDGSGVTNKQMWAPANAIAALGSLIGDAKTVLADAQALQGEVDEKTAALQSGMSEFESVRQQGSSPVWRRLWGQTALQTTQAVVQEGWQPGDTDYVIVATMSGYHDALAAAPLAGAYNAPIVLTRKTELSPAAAEEIQRLGVHHAIVVGGPAAVSEAVDPQIEALGVSVERCYGDNAQLTAVAVARRAAEAGGPSGTCIVATSRGYQDALAVAPWAYADCVPIYLTNAKGQLRDDVASELGRYGLVIIVGGEAAVPPETADRISLSGVAVQRLAGDNALITADEIAQWCVSEHGMSADRMGVATAGGYHDALAGAALCGKSNSVLVLVNKSGTNLYGVEHFVRANSESISRGYVFGGEAAVKPGVLEALESETA